MIRLIVCLLILLAYASIALAQQPAMLRSPAVQAAVVATGPAVFTYSYTVMNPSSNTVGIASMDIDISQPLNGAVLSGDGLANGTGFLAASSDVVLQTSKIAMIPVGIQSPPIWVGGLAVDGTAGWGAPDESVFIQPGVSLSGFQLVTRGLPSIRTVTVQSYIDVDQLGIKPPEGPYDVQRYRTDLVAAEANITFHGMTIGPTAPPTDFKPLGFLATIQSYEKTAAKLGWIRNFGLTTSLDAKLSAAQRALQAGDSSAARNVLGALLNEVTAQTDKGLSTEAVALLQANTQYLISRI
jgi:hypothetical protein